jgi:hypothetical protein
MISEEKLFGNFFDDRLIINGRFYNFSLDTLNRLTAANGGGDYTTLIGLISPLIITFGSEIGDVDAALNVQLGKTMTADQVMVAFGLTMKEKEGVIANALGGFGSAAYLEFYPHGFGEYTRALKTDMPVLTLRVKTAATAHSGALGVSLTTLLSGFVAQWNTARDEQEQQFATVDDNRTERTQAREALELAMLTVVHTIAALFPGDVDACNDFFAFSLLFTHTVHRTKTFSGTVAPGGILLVINHTLTDTNTVHVQNTDDNADFQLYLAHTATEEPAGRGITVKSNKGKRPKPSELGDLADTFLLIKNLSDVNPVTFIVKVGGLS